MFGKQSTASGMFKSGDVFSSDQKINNLYRSVGICVINMNVVLESMAISLLTVGRVVIFKSRSQCVIYIGQQISSN